tara:strand:+ start:7350 stop:7700 length:351 start_codon:yes stop_codon:yes gene_type:complete
MNEQKDVREGWGEYSKLVLKELERIGDNQEKMRNDFDSRFNEINLKLGEVKTIERTVNGNMLWIDKVNDVWSPSQMKEAKDEIYKQKTLLAAGIAILTFLQIVIGIAISIWGKIIN